MGIAAAEFFSANNSEKQTLSRRISPSEEQMEEQRARWDALADHLRSDLAERSDYSIRHWLQGSYKFGTQVRPSATGKEFDIDLGIYFEWDGEPENGRYAPVEIKSFVQASLKAYQSDNPDDVLEVTQPKTRCCRIRFPGDFHIDVPAYHLDAVRDARSLATQDNEWENSDPKAIYQWFVAKFDDATRAKARRHIRYFKTWVSLKFQDDKSAPSSVLVTVLVANAIGELSSDALASDDEAFKAIVDKIVERLDQDRSVPNPANPDEIISDRLSEVQFDAFLKGLKSLRDIAGRGVNATNLIAACDIWSEAFSHLFPAPDEEEIQKASGSTSRAIATLPFEPQITVRAVARNNKKAVWVDHNQIGPIPKECDIDFTLTNADALPHDADVTWTVRNEGREAENSNDLGHRGGSGLQKSEYSAYNGRHFMDCLVKRRGQILGFKRVPVIINGAPVPPRNPPRRKRTWV